MPSRLRLRPLPAFLAGASLATTILLGAYWLHRPPPVDTSEPTPAAMDHPLAPDRFVREGVWGEIAAANRLVLHAPTPPPRGPRLALPWQPQSATLLAVPLDQLIDDPALERVYRDFLTAALPVNPVTVFFHRAHRRLIPTWLQRLETVPALAPLLARISFVPAEINSMWIRDFGPFFGADAQNRLIVYDTAYLDPRIEMSNYLTTESLPGGPTKDAKRARLSAEVESVRGSDISPSIYAGHLQVEARIPTRLVRPPLIMAGGDFLPVDPRTVLLSQSTLEANGGNTEFLETRFRQYFGVDAIHYLAPLPGETIEHIDFIVQILDERSILVASAPIFDDRGRPALRLLKRELEQRLAANLRYLRQNFPRHRIIEIPLPPPLLPSDEEIVQKLFHQLLTATGRALGLEPEQIVREAAGAPGRVEISARVLQRLREQTGIERFDTPTDRGRAVAAARGQSLEALLDRHVDAFTIYRTYLNSLLIRGPQAERILVPRFRPATPEEAPLLAELEARVAAAYREARPSAELVWIDCTELARNFGAIHCFATVVPAPAALGVIQH